MGDITGVMINLSLRYFQRPITAIGVATKRVSWRLTKISTKHSYSLTQHFDEVNLMSLEECRNTSFRRIFFLNFKLAEALQVMRKLHLVVCHNGTILVDLFIGRMLAFDTPVLI